MNKLEQLKAGAIFTVGKSTYELRLIAPETVNESYHAYVRDCWISKDGSLYESMNEEYGFLVDKLESHSIKCIRSIGGVVFKTRLPLSDIHIVKPVQEKEFEYLQF